MAEDDDVDGHQASSHDCQWDVASVSCQVWSSWRWPVYEDVVQVGAVQVVYSSSLSFLLFLLLPFPFESLSWVLDLPLPLDY